ncbi:MAG: M23 family metallopeptidase [Bacteroidales bacterium]
MIKIFLKLIFLILVTINLAGQEKYPIEDFISPLDIPIKLSGTFGELRSGHFHSGIDLKTGEMEGLPVYAIADGYVSRIKIQSGGYGKALYITHTNGFVSVYAHLSRYNDLINGYVIEKHYHNRSYELDLYPDKNLFPLKQGEIVAYSGNTGRSGGPHLHFEIRSEADQKPLNPLLFGYEVFDDQAPVINFLKIYPLGKEGLVGQINKPAGFTVLARGNKYSVNNGAPVQAAGKIYFGINTIDLFYGGVNKNGVFAITLFVDDDIHYRHAFESFSFDETRFINSLIDYREYQTNKRHIQLSYIQPNNHLSIYQAANNRGVLAVEPSRTYRIKFVVEDFAGNQSELSFTLEGTAMVAGELKAKVSEEVTLFDYKKTNIFRNKDITFKVPGNALYDTLSFMYEKRSAPAGHQNPVHRLHQDLIPLHTWCNVSIRPEVLPENFRSKALIARIDEKQELKTAGGSWEKGSVNTRIREFGDYLVVIDTVPPTITPVNINPGKSLLAQQSIQVKISDELSGISHYRPTLNDEWILMEYDEKNDLLVYSFDRLLKEGENIFKIEVWDKKENYSVYSAILNY